MRAPAVLMTALLLPLTACTSYRDPVLKVTGVTLGPRSDEAIPVDFTLELANPNDEPLKLLRFEYDLIVSGRRVYSGLRSAEATLNVHATRQITMPAVVRYDRLGIAAADLAAPLDFRLSGRLSYVPPGGFAQVLLDTGLHLPEAPFSDVGRLDVGVTGGR
jgi:hypothetical protein